MSTLACDEYLRERFSGEYVIERMNHEFGEDGYFEEKISASFYRHVFMHFFSNFFPKKIREVKGTKKSTVFITTLCEMKNADGELVLWYSYESEGEKYMVLNGKVFERNEMLMGMTEHLIKHSTAIIPK